MISIRQKRVASLIKEELGRLLIEGIQSSSSGLITLTRVEMTGDLKTAHIYVSFLGKENEKEELLNFFEKKKGYLRKAIASKVKLKYNPQLIFTLDKTYDYEKRIEELLESTRKNEE